VRTNRLKITACFRVSASVRQWATVEGLETRRLLSLDGNQLFPSDNPWNHPITDAPIAANSATLVSSIGASKPLHPDFGSVYNGYLNGIPYNTVTGSQPKVNVTIDAYPSESDLDPVPIPDGAVIEGDAPGGQAEYQQQPAYAQVSLAGQNAYTWSSTSSDPRAVADPVTAGNRVASTWYSSTQFTLNLNITDGQAHRIALYLLDWDSQGRAEAVSVLNPANGQVLATQSASNFSGGKYLIFDVTGQVQLQFTNTSGPNAVLSGLFFGAPGSPTLPASSAPAAAFVSADAITQGSWQGVYGADGYFLPPVNGGGDQHLLVYDQTNNIVYELFDAHRPSEEPDGQWHADSEAVWNLNTDDFRTPGFTSADAAGLPILPGLVRPDEVLQQGAIDHALRFTVPASDAAYVFPASHEAGVNNPNLPRMGERFRLDPNFNIASFSAADQVILQALKTYGMIVADNGSSWFISGTPSDQWNDDTLHQLTSVLGSNFQAVNLTPVVSSMDQTSGSTGGGTSVTIHGVNFTGVAGQLSVSFGGVAATNVTVINDTTLVATAPAESAGTVDVTITTPYGTSVTSASDRFTYSAAALPPYITASSGAVYNYNPATEALSLTSGTLTFTADAGSNPLVNLSASGSASKVIFNTSEHIAGLTLSSGATATVLSLGAARTNSNHNVLVIGTLGAANDPTFSVDSSSKLDLTDNDLIVHSGSSDATGNADYANVNAKAVEGRNPASGKPGSPDGQWNGNGLDSSAATAADSAAGYERIALGVVLNSTLFVGPFSSWQVGSFNETLAASDIIVKYTYLGDYGLFGKVYDSDAAILQRDFDNGKTNTHTWATGSSMDDGLSDASEAGVFQFQYGLGTGGREGPQL
jgi:hypothetical protein